MLNLFVTDEQLANAFSLHVCINVCSCSYEVMLSASFERDIIKSKTLPHLCNVVHVGEEAVHADLQQHDQSPAHILPHFRLFVPRQCKQVLQHTDRSGVNKDFYSSQQDTTLVGSVFSGNISSPIRIQ